MSNSCSISRQSTSSEVKSAFAASREESHPIPTTIVKSSLPNFSKNLTDIVTLGTFHTLGNVFTLYAMSLLSVPLVLTIKATEPIFTVFLLKCLSLQDAHLDTPRCTTMAIMVIGTILATVEEVEFESSAFTATVVANFGFQMRNIYAKYFSKVSWKGGYNYGLISASTFVLVSLAMGCRFVVKSYSTCTFNLKYHSIIEIAKSSNWQTLLGLVTVSGVCHASYNFFSFRVLSFVSPITHSVLNSLKRLLIIWAAIILLKSPVTNMGLFGSFLVIMGKFYSTNI